MRRPTPTQTAEHRAAWEAYRRDSGQEAPVIRSLVAADAGMEATFREQFMAACFLEDVLVEMGAPAAYRKDALFTFGRMCFGRSPWDAFDAFLPRCEADVKALTSRSEWSDVPVEQDVPAPTPLLTEWWEMAKRHRNDKGVFPHVFLSRGPDDKVAVHSLDMRAAAVRTRVLLEIQTTGPVEFVFGQDMAAVPGQGTEFNDFLAVVWYLDGEFYTGVVDYQVLGATPPEGESEPAFRPIRWDNNYWNHSLREKDPIPAMIQALEVAHAPRGEA
jgi:hypothetical protein